MSDDESGKDSFEETVREIAREVSKSVERAMEQVDFEEIAGAFGVEPGRAREWVDSASGWLRSQVENIGEDAASWAASQEAEHATPAEVPPAGAGATPKRSAPKPGPDDPLRNAGPHPLDVPTEEQGLALAALDSGRWTVEPGTNALASQGDGPGPSDALGLVRELRARDWIAADGTVTVVGRHALKRWLDVARPE
ncbi:MAG TPA: hypothetical protein VMU39_15790 [Solirubrobacteraceae bacterium]|nr:hypothetical protein [Solirubrobacteraceae bacterium]